MRLANFPLIPTAAATATITSSKIDSNQLFRFSAQIVVGAGTSLGTLQLQVSNDPCAYGNVAMDFTPTNWSNLGSATAINTAGVTLIAQQEICYRWMRAIYTDTFAVINTITAVADVAGSLNSKYFLINSPSVSYYVWMNVNSAGVDPMVAGKTGIEVDLGTGDAATAVATAIAAALDALPAFVSAAVGAVVTSTNAVGGPVAAYALDSVPAPTGFGFAHTDATSSITVNVNCLGV